MFSCAKSEVSDLNVSNPDVIMVDTYVGQTTKGTIFEQDDLKAEGFGLMAYYTKQNTWTNDGGYTPDFMYNQSVVYNSALGTWSYDPIKYWPNEEQDKVTFFAYAPYQTYSEDGIGNGVKASYTANDAEGLPQIKFYLQKEAADMVDFVAGQNMDMVRQQDKVTFNLKHQLTRATFSAKTKVDNVAYGANKSGDGASYVVVKSMDVLDGGEFFTKGIYTFDNETTDNDKTNHDQDGTWSAFEPSAYSFESIMDYQDYEAMPAYLTDANYEETGVVIPIAQTAYSSLFADDEYLFLIPPTADGLSEEGIQIEIVYDIVTIDSKLAAGHSATQSVYTVTLPAGTLLQGKAYNFQLEFDVTEILVRAVVIDWDDEITSDSGIVDPFDAIDITINTDDFEDLNVVDDAEKEIQIVVGGEDADQIVSWGSDNESVATVDAAGVVLIMGNPGTAVITGYNAEGVALVSFSVVVADVEVSEVVIGTNSLPSQIEYVAGGTVGTVSATTDGVDQGVVWSTSPEGILAVDEGGKVIMLEQAEPATTTVTLTATSSNGVYSSVDVEVIRSTVALSAEKTTLEIGDTQAITATITGFEQAVSWTVEPTEVMSVSNAGVVTALAEGTAIITAELTCGSTATIEFIVTLQDDAPEIISAVDQEGYLVDLTEAITLYVGDVITFTVDDFDNTYASTTMGGQPIEVGKNSNTITGVNNFTIKALEVGTALVNLTNKFMSGVTIIDVKVIERPVAASSVEISIVDGVSTDGAYTGVFFYSEEQIDDITEKNVNLAIALDSATTEELSDYTWSWTVTDSSRVIKSSIESTGTGTAEITTYGYTNMTASTMTIVVEGTNGTTTLTDTIDIVVYAEIGTGEVTGPGDIEVTVPDLGDGGNTDLQ